jgi:hypothetical protein
MKYCLFILMGCIFFFRSGAQNNCFQEEKDSAEHWVFTKMEIYPNYDRCWACGGGNSENKLRQLILSNLNFYKITTLIKSQFFTDTLNVKLIIDKQGKMSNLTVKSSKFSVLEDEFRRIIISSACNWNPGTISGVRHTAWYKKNMILNFDGRGSSLSVKIEFIKD